MSCQAGCQSSCQAQNTCNKCNTCESICESGQNIGASAPWTSTGEINISASAFNALLDKIVAANKQKSGSGDSQKSLNNMRAKQGNYITADIIKSLAQDVQAMSGGSVPNGIAKGEPITSSLFSALASNISKMKYRTTQCGDCISGCQSCNAGCQSHTGGTVCADS